MTIRAIISRAEAKAQGLKRYFTGIPCKHGHVCERYVTKKCVECNTARYQEWRKNNKEYFVNYSRARYSEDPARSNAASKLWREANPERNKVRVKAWKGNNAERVRETMKGWRENNPDRVNASLHARRAREHGAEGHYAESDVLRLLGEQDNKCLCTASFNVVSYTIDHIIPLSRGGSNWPDNLQLLCSFCNGSKGIKLMSEWVVPDRRVA